MGWIVCSSAPDSCNLLPLAGAAAAGLPCLVALEGAELSIPPGTRLGVTLVAGDLPCLVFYGDTSLLAASLPSSGMQGCATWAFPYKPGRKIAVDSHFFL